MRRVVLALGGTIAGLAMLLSFKSHGAATGATAAAGTLGPTSPAQGGGAADGSATRTVTGAAGTTQYGPMQIALTLAGQRITKVTVLQQTDTGAESGQIDSFAIPKLVSETLAAQSDRIDAVTGASYTSAGYIQSLQSAIDKARG